MFSRMSKSHKVKLLVMNQWLKVGGLVLLLFIIAWGLEWMQKREGINPQPRIPISIIDTSNWQTFKHLKYPYEIKYPPRAIVRNSYLDLNYYPASFEGQGIDILPYNNDPNEIILIIGNVNTYGGRVVVVDKEFDLQSFVYDEVNRQLGPSMPRPDAIVEKVVGNGWEGYQYHLVGTQWPAELFIQHAGTLYNIAYNKGDPVETAIIQSLRFVE